MIHIHIFKKVGDWHKASWGLKVCRCGAHELHDLWGFAFEHTYEQKLEIIAKLRKEAGL